MADLTTDFLGITSPNPFWLASAPPTDKPVRLLVPEHDQFRTPAAATEATAGWANATIEIVPGTDHFLAGGLGVVMDQLSSFVDQVA